MSEPHAAPSRTPPQPLSTGRYVAAVAGLCVLMALLGAGAHSVAEEVGTPSSIWLAWVVTFVLTTVAVGLFARYVGNPTAWIICGVFFGLSTEQAGEEIGKLAGGPWVRVVRVGLIILAYLFWVLVIHHRLAGRPNPRVPAWGR